MHALTARLLKLVEENKAIQENGLITVMSGKLMGEWQIPYSWDPNYTSGHPTELPPNQQGYARLIGLRFNPRLKSHKLHRTWLRTGMGRLHREFGAHLGGLSYQSGISYRTLELLFLLTGTRLFQAYQAHPVRFCQNFGPESGMGASVLNRMPYRLRWRLVQLCYRMSWKKAIRRVWPRVHPQVLNDLGWNDCSHGTKKLLRWANEPGSLMGYIKWRQARPFASHLSKEKWLVYHSKYGMESDWLLEYYRELRQARELYLPVPEWEGLMPEPKEAKRRHDEIARIIKASQTDEMPAITELHRQNWARFEVPSGWKPLVSFLDFQNEGDELHHCVGGYYHRTNSMLCSVQLDGERATLQWSLRSDIGWEETLGTSNHPVYHITQLYGTCNAQVSQKLQEWVRSCLAKMTTPKAAQAHQAA